MSKLKSTSNETLELEVQQEEEVGWRQLGHLKTWAPGTKSLRIVVPPSITHSRLLDSIRLSGSCFEDLKSLEIQIRGATWPVNQVVIAGACELLGLNSLHIAGGELHYQDLNLHVLTGLKNLKDFKLVGCQGDGLDDHVLENGLALLTQLTSLEVRGNADTLSDKGLSSLSSLTGLQQLSVLPLGLECTKAGMAALCAPLRQLTSLQAGFSCSRQVDILQAVPARVNHVGVIVCDEGCEVPSLLTTCALCLGSGLKCLRLNTVKVEDASFLLALGSLTALQELSFAVGQARRDAPGFMLNIAVLAQLKELKSLEVAVIGRKILLPLTAKQMPHLIAAWPHLTSLSLSCMVPPQRLDNVRTQQSGSGLPSQRSTSLYPTASRELAGEYEKVNDASTLQLALPRTQSGLEDRSSASMTRTLARLQSLGFRETSSGQLKSVASMGADARAASSGNAAPGTWRGPLQPTALALLQGFTKLEKLALYAPLVDPEEDSTIEEHLVYDSDEEWDDDEDPHNVHHHIPAVRRIPIFLDTLPPSLQDIVLERAEVLLESYVAVAAGGRDSEATPGQQQVLPGLQSLSLSYCKASDAVMLQLFDNSPHLTRLELSETHGISCSTLQGLSRLIKLSHLEVVDSRPAPHNDPQHVNGRSLSTALSGSSTRFPSFGSNRQSQDLQRQHSTGVSWWGWLMGAQPEPSDTHHDHPRHGSHHGPGNVAARSVHRSTDQASLGAVARLQQADIIHLAQLATLRHLQWSVGGPLRVPDELCVKAATAKQAQHAQQGSSYAAWLFGGGGGGGNAAKDPQAGQEQGDGGSVDPAVQLGPQGYACIQALRAACAALASPKSCLRDLHELCLDCVPDPPDLDQSRLADLLAPAVADKAQLLAQYRTRHETASLEAGAIAVIATSQQGSTGSGKVSPAGEDYDHDVSGRAKPKPVSDLPTWLRLLSAPACKVSSRLPVSHFDPWSDVSYHL